MYAMPATAESHVARHVQRNNLKRFLGFGALFVDCCRMDWRRAICEDTGRGVQRALLAIREGLVVA